MNIIKIFCIGVIKIFSPQRSAPVKKSVAESLRGDWYKIGCDFRKVLTHGKQKITAAN